MKKLLTLTLALTLFSCVNERDFPVHGTTDAYLEDNDMAMIHNKWNSARVQNRWQEYQGTMVRASILLDSGDMREMRLKLIPNADGGDINGDAEYILEQVAKFEMGAVCGRNVKHIDVVYDQPAFEAVRSTPYFEYRVRTANIPLREYGFRCIYKGK
ncbi:hypothetical protein FACS18945_4810 [Bacteroidia bacterium]|nr:hypothetical protein FACS18945_4810 [Bacteroidia bacterium]